MCASRICPLVDVGDRYRWNGLPHKTRWFQSVILEVYVLPSLDPPPPVPKAMTSNEPSVELYVGIITSTLDGAST